MQYLSLKNTIFTIMLLSIGLFTTNCTKEKEVYPNNHEENISSENFQAMRPNVPCPDFDNLDYYDQVAKYIAIGLTELAEYYPVYQDLLQRSQQNSGEPFSLCQLLNTKCSTAPIDSSTGEKKEYAKLLAEAISCKFPDLCQEFNVPPYSKILTEELLKNAIHNNKRYAINVYFSDYKPSKNHMPFYIGVPVTDNQNKVLTFFNDNGVVKDYGYSFSDTLSKNLILLEPGEVIETDVQPRTMPCADAYIRTGSWGGNNGNGNGGSTGGGNSGGNNGNGNQADKKYPRDPDGFGLKVIESKICCFYQKIGKPKLRLAYMYLEENPQNQNQPFRPSPSFSNDNLNIDNIPRNRVGTWFNHPDRTIADKWGNNNTSDLLWLIFYEKDDWVSKKNFYYNNNIHSEVLSIRIKYPNSNSCIYLNTILKKSVLNAKPNIFEEYSISNSAFKFQKF